MENYNNKLKSDFSRVYTRESTRKEYDYRKKEYYGRESDINGHSDSYKSYRNEYPHKYRRKDQYFRRENSRSPERYWNRNPITRGRGYSRSNSVSPDRVSCNNSKRYSNLYSSIEKNVDSKLDKVKKDLEYSNRDDLTVLVLNLNLDAQEFEVYEFFTTYAGNVRDIRIIRDHRTGRSKGVCYVEFYSVESVLKALKLNGQKIMDTSITIQASQAEKNRAAKLAKLEEIKAETTPLLLRVDGLVGLLSRIRRDEIDSLFSTFGKVTNIEIEVDRKTQTCLGFAYILFEKAIEGHDAIKALNNFEIAGQKITVSISQESHSSVKIPNSLVSSPSNSSLPVLGMSNSQNDLSKEKSSAYNLERVSEFDKLDESEEAVLLGADSRNFLTKKLLARTHSKINNSTIQETSKNSNSPTIVNTPLNLFPSSPPLNQPSNINPDLPSSATHSQSSSDQKMDDTTNSPASNQLETNYCCLLFSNMFTEQSIKESMEEDETVEQILEEIQADVEEECEKYGKLLGCFLDKEKKDGNVWVKYSNPEEASKAQKVFHKRFFGGRELNVTFIKDEDFPKLSKS
ncbi:splicing factor with 3 RRM domains [Cryptosporidium ubiquitum]|uniref:Splicing factor with 3 RRM domains n=1 Tax=Cryptosporidium ubiquitum TaxID=857276 RepID=A0A1J4MLN9_9CRYT|nr:splicing factor with 3 RRM domains [Cryptosporidium ubiquitum]OII75178.1 splicing factor with 3 RRM domains [Cryptosporidium ubiquitum]